jgi:hypothetical protein
MQTLYSDELQLDAYEVSPERGFLLADDPLPYLGRPVLRAVGANRGRPCPNCWSLTGYAKSWR